MEKTTDRFFFPLFFFSYSLVIWISHFIWVSLNISLLYFHFKKKIMTISTNESQILILSVLVNISPWADMSFRQNYMNDYFAEKQLLSVALKSQCCCVLLPSYDKYEFYFLPSLVQFSWSWSSEGLLKISFLNYLHFFSKII